ATPSASSPSSRPSPRPPEQGAGAGESARRGAQPPGKAAAWRPSPELYRRGRRRTSIPTIKRGARRVNPPANFFERLLSRVVVLRPGEGRAAALLFLNIFTLLFAYYLIKP